MDIKSIRDKLRVDFPALYVKDIDNALKLNKQSYPATFYYLQDKVASNTFKLKQGYHARKPALTGDKLKEFINLVDPRIECSCCCDEKEIEKFGQCTDGHLICKVCIKKHAENTIYQLLSCKVKCIDCTEKCYGEYDETTLKEILDERVFAEYKNLKKINEMKEISVDDINIKICQHCGAGTDIGEFNNQSLLVCMECFKDTCLLCNQVDHPGKQCYALGNIRQSKRQEIEDKMSEALIIKCIECNKSILKGDGCNKITCICGTISCNICKEKISRKIGYNHFCVKHDCDCNKCHLWDNNEKKRIINSVMNFSADNEVKKLLKGLL